MNLIPLNTLLLIQHNIFKLNKMKQEEINSILAAFRTGNIAKTETIINELKDKGNAQLFSSLTDEYMSFDKNVKQSIYTLFCDIKDQSIAEIFVNKIKNSTDHELQEILLSAAWNSRLDFTNYLETFIDIVTECEFQLAFEAFTVIENVEAKVSEERKGELVDYVKSKIGKCNEQTLVLAHDLVSIINGYELL